MDFLTSPDTVYPVYIDPSLTINSGNEYIEDVSVYSESANTNYGSANLCFVGLHPSYGTAETLMRFPGLELSTTYTITHNIFIESASLTLRAQTGSTTAATAKLYPLKSDSWTESGATWNNIEEHAEDHTESPMAQGALLTGSAMSFDLTNFVKNWKVDNAHYPYTLEQGFLMVSSNEEVQKRFCSSEISTTSYRPYLTINYREGVEILSPDQPYRAVGENEIVYVKQGEMMQLEAAICTTDSSFQWTSSNNSVVSVSTTSITTPMLNPTTCGTATISVANGSNVVLDSIEVYVVPVVPGEYYIETPLQSNRFIEPMTTVSANATLTVGALAEDEDNRLVLDFVPDDDFGYYTIKKIVKNGIVYTPWYLGAPSSTNGMEIRYFDDADTNGRWFDIEKNPLSGYYRITPQLSGQWNRSLAADASSPVGTKLTIQTYTDDQNYNDEWILHRVMPLSGSEKTVNSSFWNNQIDLNCVSYAINSNYRDSEGKGIMGFTGSVADVILPWNENNVYEAFRRTAQEYGFLVERIGKYEACPEGYYKIAIAYADLNDAGSAFHLYRQGVNGLWSHKKMLKTVSVLDADNKIIVDPEISDRSFGDNTSHSSTGALVNYPYFVGYFAINPGNLLQPS